MDYVQEQMERSYGAAIRKIREQHGLKQSDVVGLTDRQVGRIERGECRATRAALAKLAAAHKMTTPEYLEKLASVL